MLIACVFATLVASMLVQKIYARCNKDDHWRQCQAYADLTTCQYIYIDSYDQFR